MIAELYEAFYKKVYEIDPCFPVAYEGVDFTPPEDGIWLEPKIFNSEPISIVWDNNDTQVDFGFFQILVYFRPNAGSIEAAKMADKIALAFKKGTIVGSVTVEKTPHTTSVVADDDNLFIPVTIHYRGIT